LESGRGLSGKEDQQHFVGSVRVRRRPEFVQHDCTNNMELLCGLSASDGGNEDRQHFDCATWLHKAREMPKGKVKREVEKEVTGRETEAWEINVDPGLLLGDQALNELGRGQGANGGAPMRKGPKDESITPGCNGSCPWRTRKSERLFVTNV
jgi:hypothetical protein